MRSLALFTLLFLLLGSAPAMGSDFAFATDGVNPPGSGPLELPQNGVGKEVHLFLDIAGEEVSSTKCVEGATGDEICGFDVIIEIKGDHQIVSFAPSSAPDSAPGLYVKFSQQIIDSTTAEIHAVGLDAIDPGVLAIPIGVLTLDTGPVEGSVIVRGTVIPSDIGVDPLPKVEDEIVAVVPEPGSILVLIAGILTLGVLHSLRSRRHSLFSVHASH
jgi:hypothetical protein